MLLIFSRELYDRQREQEGSRLLAVYARRDRRVRATTNSQPSGQGKSRL